MTAKERIRDAKAELWKAAQAFKAGDATEGSVKAALIWLERAWEENPTEDEQEEIRYLECLAHCTNSDYDTAYENFKKSYSGREIPLAWRRLGTIIYMIAALPSDLGAALEECNQAIIWLQENDDDSAMIVGKAILYGRKAFCHLKLDQHADAIACCEIASRLLPEHLAPLRIMAEIELRRGDYEGAIKYLSRSIVNRPQGPHFWDYANRGNAFLETGNLRGALSDLGIALELEPSSPLILSNFGLAMDQRGDTTRAWRFYNRALMHDYQWVPAHSNRGALFFRGGDYKQAEEEFARAIRLEPGNASLWFNRGLSRFEQLMYGECLLDMSQAIRLGNLSWEARYVTAMCQGRLKEYSTAIVSLKTLVLNHELDRETSSLIWNNMGVMEHRRDNLERSHMCFLEALIEDRLNDQATANLARIESVMSGASLEPTEENTVQLSAAASTSGPQGLSQSDIINTIGIWTNMAGISTNLLVLEATRLVAS